MSTLLGSVVDFFSNLVTNGMNKNNVKWTNESNREIARDTNASNMAMNQANIEMQQRENEIARQREDNAVQRRAADLMGAGLSKTLAAGSPASANAMQAPQNTMAAQTGAPMQAHKAVAYQGFETAANHARQNQIAEKELDIREDELNEKIRANQANEDHAKAVLEEQKKYNRMVNHWKEMEYNQNSAFHQDAMKISWAQTQIDFLSYLNEVDKTELQNMWWSGQLELQAAAGERDAARLTAELSEASARTAKYLEDINLSKAQIALLEKEGKLMFTEAMKNIAQIRNLNKQTESIVVGKLTSMWNLLLSVKGKSKTTNPDVSPSQADENSKNRHASLRNTLISVGAGAVLAGIAGFFKSGIPGRIRQKMFDETHGDWYRDL